VCRFSHGQTLPPGTGPRTPDAGRCPSSIQREGREIPNNGRRLEQPGSGKLASSDDPASARDQDGEPVGASTSLLAEALASAASRDVIAMGVGAVMALHSIHEAKARIALARVATRYQVSISDVARAFLTLAAGTEEPLSDGAARAAAQLLVRGFTNSA
jgi:hypothetical protein